MLRKLREHFGQSGTRPAPARSTAVHGLDADEMLRGRYGHELFACQYDLDGAGLLFTHMGHLRLPYLGGHHAPELPQETRGHSFRQVFGPPEGHLLTIAGENGEAWSRQIIQNILTYRGSMVILDPDGRYHAATHHSRADDPDSQTALRGVYRFDPFGEHTDRYNPMDALTEEASGTWDDAVIMADALVTARDGEDETEQWARALLAVILFHVARTREETERTLATVRELTSGRNRMLGKLLEEMAVSEEERVAETTDAYGALDRAFRQTVRDRLDQDLAIWDMAELRAATAETDEDFQMRYLHLSEGTTLYLVIPEDRLAECAPVVRLMLGQAATCFDKPRYNTPIWADARPAGPPVMLIVDRIAELGTMAPLVDRALAYDSRHLKMWWFVHDIGELATVSGEGMVDVMFHRFQAICFHGVDDEPTAERLARLLDEWTMRKRKQLRIEDQEFISEREIRNLPPSTAIALIAGLPPALLRLPEYHDVAELRGRYAE